MPSQPTPPTTRDEIPAKPKRTLTPEHLAKLREGYFKSENKGGRQKGLPKPTKQEARQEALKELEPIAIQVLRDQLHHEDPKIQQSAAIKVIEYSRGKPTQQIKQETTVTSIEYRSAAWRPMSNRELEESGEPVEVEIVREELED